MTLQEFVTQYLAVRGAGGIVLTEQEVLDAAIAAARFYSGYAEIRSLITIDPVTSDPIPVTDPSIVVADTTLTLGEWSIIKPLFVLYVDRENAIRLEASRGLGVDPYGRSVSEIAAEIGVMENEVIPSKTFCHVITEVV